MGSIRRIAVRSLRYSALKSVFYALAWTFLICALQRNLPAQQNATNQEVAVTNTRMGAYHALADLIYQSFLKGDYATAATLAGVLDRTWDKGESFMCSDGLVRTDLVVREEIDHPMDVFIQPIIDYKKKKPDPAAVKAAYEAYLDRLRLADKPLD